MNGVMPMPEIVKIQRCLEPPDGPWMVYDQHRQRRQYIDPSDVPAHVKVAMGEAHKGYFRATWTPPGGWTITKKVADQNW